MPMGFVVDGVSEVLNLTAPGNRRHARISATILAGQYLLGMAKVKGKVKILLEIDKVMTDAGLEGLRRASPLMDA